MQNITILGSTGSIGTQTLDVIRQHINTYNIFALTAASNIDLLAQQCLEFKPRYAVIVDPSLESKLQELLQLTDTTVLSGSKNVVEVAKDNDVAVVVAAIVGSAGLLPSLAAVEAGKRVLLANKEVLVMAGELIMRTAAKRNASIIPIDSEHNAVLQCLDVRDSNSNKAVQKILLTASGGPFLHSSLDTLSTITPKEACMHPNWHMGAKISIDSATMMNKGLEIIEAYYLFGIPAEKIDAVIHPQSLIHAFVYYNDGSTLAHAAIADMQIPISHALAWPNRLALNVESLDIFALNNVEFLPIDKHQFPCFYLAKQALTEGKTAPLVLNTANEIANQAFIEGRIKFTDIPTVVEQVLEQTEFVITDSIDNILHCDAQARSLSASIVTKIQ
jgi:1-deoxy-D-xylulose-5-phosphate reductoisomerase